MIVAIDASTTGCSVALFKERKVVVGIHSKVDRTSAENLTLMIKEALKLANASFEDLKAVAVAKGPGSYTGLRIAVSTAKGLAFGLDLPLISYGSLSAMCYQLPWLGAIDLLCPMIDARRMEVFSGFYNAESKEEFIPIEAVLVNEDSYREILKTKKVLFFGEGADKCRSVLNHPNAYFADTIIYPNAESAVTIVSDKFENAEFEDLVTFEPFYLKEYMFKTK